MKTPSNDNTRAQRLVEYFILQDRLNIPRRVPYSLFRCPFDRRYDHMTGHVLALRMLLDRVKDNRKQMRIA